MFLFLALARGWGTTRAYLPPDTWRFHSGLSFAFFVCLTVFSRYAVVVDVLLRYIRFISFYDNNT